MTEADGGAARDFDGLDAREAQTALAEELSSESDVKDTDDKRIKLVSESEDTPEDGAASDDNSSTLEGTPSEDPQENEASTEQDEQSADETPIDGGDESVAVDTCVVEWSEEDLAEHKRMVEALLFAAAEPLDAKSIADRIPVGADIQRIIERLCADYEGRGVTLQKIGTAWRFVTAQDVAHILDKERVTPKKLSRAAMETLAIIAYHQPCTRADIEDVRGVQVAKGSLDQLLEIGWVRLAGKRRDVPGRPTLYRTTPAFLEQFSLSSIEDLPGLADLKAAGLLDARLPPGFSVPSPASDDEMESEECEESHEFAQDFLNDETQEEDADA